jgi:hypothetical protein
VGLVVLSVFIAFRARARFGPGADRDESLANGVEAFVEGE